jgi:hypothetical protein
VSDVLDLLAAKNDTRRDSCGLSLPESDDITAALQFAARQSDHLILQAA